MWRSVDLILHKWPLMWQTDFLVLCIVVPDSGFEPGLREYASV